MAAAVEQLQHLKVAEHPVVSPLREPLILGHKAPADVTEDIARVLEQAPGRGWWLLFAGACSLLIAGISAITYTITTGIGTWGLNKTVGWAFDITNFVFWIGIGHAGTFISAILFLLNQ